MAKYKKEYTEDGVKNTLLFMGIEFEEEWEEFGAFCREPILVKVEEAFPEITEEMKVYESVENLGSMGDDEVICALVILSNYEQKQMADVDT